MRIGIRYWLIAGVFALALNAAVIILISLQQNSAGAATIQPGPKIEMADSLAGILGEPLEVSENDPAKIEEVEPQPELVETSEPMELAATAPVVVPENVSSLEALPVAPATELETTEPAAVLTPVLPEKVETKPEPKEVVQPPPKKVKTKEVKKTKKQKVKKKAKQRTTKARGNKKKGNAGKSKKKAGASKAAIASFGSQVRSRIASAARRAGKRGKGSVRVNVRISSSGSASISVSGPGALASSVRSAVSGTSFPRPPAGAPRSYSVSITFR